MTAAAEALLATVGDHDVSRWEAFWDPSNDDEPYYLHARDRDGWYRIEADDAAHAERANATTATRDETSARRVRLTGSWPAGALAPAYGYVRMPSRRRASSDTVASSVANAIASATTVAVIAAAMESLARSRRRARRGAGLPAQVASGAAGRALGRAVTVRVDG